MIKYLFIVYLLSCVITGFCQDSLAFRVFLKNIIVPQEQIFLDSISNGRYFYSGNATFDLESTVDSVNIYVFLEEVPFKRYFITHLSASNANKEDIFTGNAQYKRIDSLCSGDVGWVKPGKNHIVYWHYSTKNLKNHCRLKIGLGNYLYANTKIMVNKKGIPQQSIEYDYNDLGLLAESRAHALTSNPTLVDSKKTPKYTLNGQILVDDTANPFVKNAYDNQSRAFFRQQADSGGFNIHFILGYVYDSLSRAVQIQYLSWGATPQNPGVPFNIEFISYDAVNRVALINSGFSCIVNTCNPVYEFKGKESQQFYYEDNLSNQVDSIVRAFRDTSRNDKFVSRIVDKYYYRPDGLKQEGRSIAMGLDDSGTCWGIQNYDEQKSVYSYDSIGYKFRTDFWERSSIDSSFTQLPTTSLCYRRVYDAMGNTIQQFDFCDQNESLVLTAQYDKFNHMVQMISYNQNDTLISTFLWDLLDLNSQREYLHE